MKRLPWHRWFSSAAVGGGGKGGGGSARASNQFAQRTHTCGELRLSNEGERVQLCGWLSNKRMSGRFLVLRDAYGYTQARVSEEKLESMRDQLNGLYCESALRVSGRVADRGSGNRNPKMPTGEVEVVLEEMEVLNGAPAVLPLSMDPKKPESFESTRLTHRHLDLRLESMQRNLRLRSRLVHRIRGYFESMDFVDVETPTLSQWTPGGAAEFIVPAPKPHQGQYYTLPQSPQIYKQLLMCGGLDRYYQIAKCYRDEGAKSDRQPEFTQVDMELSFTDQQSVMSLVEQMIVAAWPEEMSDSRPQLPFPRMTYAESMRRYGTDKPDLRRSKPTAAGRQKQLSGFQFLWVVDFPLFSRNESTGAVESTHHPFTAPVPEHAEDLRQGRNLLEITAQHYDLVLNGVELGGGSIRIHNSELQRNVFDNILHLPTDTLDNFLRALSYGAPPHGGFALGLDRFVMLMANGGEASGTSIRDVIAFPKSSAGRCLTMGAPNTLPEEYLKERM